MIKIVPTKKGYKLVYTICVNGKRHRLKRLFKSFLHCKQIALDFSKKMNRTVLIYAEAEIKFKVIGV